MSIVSFNKIKEIAEKTTKQTHIVNLGRIDKQLSEINIPIRIKSFEEVLKLQSKVKLDREKLTIEWLPFSRLSKSLKDVIRQDENFRNSVNMNTYFQVLKLEEDKQKIEIMQFRERLFSILIHLDMEYQIDGKTMWEELGIPKDDYNKLIDIFSSIIVYENHLELLSVIVESIKNGAFSDAELDQAIQLHNWKKYFESLDDEQKKEWLAELGKVTSQLQSQESATEKEESKEDK